MQTRKVILCDMKGTPLFDISATISLVATLS